MDQGANLRDTAMLMAAKAVLAKTGRSLATALEEAVSDAERFGMWLEGAGPADWERQLRLRSEKLTIARNALFRKQIQMTADGRPPSVVDEKKAVRRAEQSVEEAQHCLKALKRWAIEYQRILGQFRAGLGPLSNYVESVIPKAIASINRMAMAVDAYLATQPGKRASTEEIGLTLPVDPDAAGPEPGARSMRRGGSAEVTPEEDPRG
ncbi:MAG: hypothetical protein EXS03_00405 [Phycisphaerales bacterium]|nr:hypothetical protein [Phycisphaerales bacterium]